MCKALGQAILTHTGVRPGACILENSPVCLRGQHAAAVMMLLVMAAVANLY